MEFFLTIIVVGMAVGYLTELLSSLLSDYLSVSLTKKIATLPLGLLFSWFAGVQGLLLLVAAPAAGFFALVVMTFLNRPVVVNQGRSRVL